MKRAPKKQTPTRLVDDGARGKATMVLSLAQAQLSKAAAAIGGRRICDDRLAADALRHYARQSRGDDRAALNAVADSIHMRVRKGRAS